MFEVRWVGDGNWLSETVFSGDVNKNGRKSGEFVIFENIHVKGTTSSMVAVGGWSGYIWRGAGEVGDTEIVLTLLAAITFADEEFVACGLADFVAEGLDVATCTSCCLELASCLGNGHQAVWWEIVWSVWSWGFTDANISAGDNRCEWSGTKEDVSGKGEVKTFAVGGKIEVGILETSMHDIPCGGFGEVFGFAGKFGEGVTGKKIVT